MGRGETDVDTYTTCSHEILREDKGEDIIWNKERDIVFLDSASSWAQCDKAPYIWGGKTGIKFGRMRRVAMTCDNVMSGLGEWSLGFEAIDFLVVLVPEQWKREYLDTPGRWSWANRSLNLEGYIQKMLGSRGLTSSEGELIEVKCVSATIDEVMDSFASGELREWSLSK